ncbi:MAG: pyridoxamine 5'-phosphate oxidase family protein [Candidatus Hodarchaeales archaeon]|jgi:general stress protein 26
MKFDEVWEHFQNYPTVHLATVDDGHPRVRPMTLILYDEKIWMVTHTEKNKVAEIQKNNKMEFSFVFMKDKLIGCIRATGLITIINDKDTRKELSKVIIFFPNYWRSVEDPNFTLLKLELSHIYYSPPTEDGMKYLFDLTKGKDVYTKIPPYRLSGA